MAEPVPITASLDGIMKSPDAVGENVAAHVRPVRLDQGVLTVEADDSAWATQVKFLSGTISARLAEVANVQVSRIDVRVARTR